MDLNEIHTFPRVSIPCPSCQGDGVIDTSYHGSPDYETCPTCNADKTKKFARDMTVNEKLEYLLMLIHKPPFLRTP